MPRLRPVRTKEEAAQVPSDESLDIDLTEPEIELSPSPAEAGLQPQEPASEPEEPEPEQAQPEVKDEVATLKERLAASERAAEAQRQRLTELEQQHRTAVDAGTRSQEDAEEARYVAILNALESAENESKVAVSDLEKAENDGDIKLKVDATKRLARAERALASHEEAKLSYEAARRDKKERPQQQQPTGDRIDVAYAHLPQLARNWLRNHQDYTTDPRKIARLGALHWEIVDGGHEQFSQGYLDALDVKLGLKQAPAVQTAEPAVQPEPRRAAVTSAPPTREAPSLTTGKPQSSRITLTPEQREAAKISNVDDVTYARGVMRLQNEKKNGRYQERG